MNVSKRGQAQKGLIKETKTTYKSNIGEQIREDPNPWFREHECPDIEYQPHNRDRKEQPNQS